MLAMDLFLRLILNAIPRNTMLAMNPIIRRLLSTKDHNTMLAMNGWYLRRLLSAIHRNFFLDLLPTSTVKALTTGPITIMDPCWSQRIQRQIQKRDSKSKYTPIKPVK